MHVVVVGATGNVGTSTVQALAADPGVTSVLGLARREPDLKIDKVRWARADVNHTDLVSHFRGADAVVHLAWLFQPTRSPAVTWRTNVLGSTRVFLAVAEAGVPCLVYSSSVGAYSPGPKDRAVDEEWPTHGWPGAAYSREKAYVERLLDGFESDHPDRRVVRLRPAFMFKRESAYQQRRLFGGPLVPGRLVRPGKIPIIPAIPGLRFQALHTSDAGDAFRRAVTHERARGPINLAAEPPIGSEELAAMLGARTVPLSPLAAHSALRVAWSLGLVPTAPELLDLALHIPIMNVSRAREELGWTATHTAIEALGEFLEGLRTGADLETPPLAQATSGATRLRSLVTGGGRRP